VLNGSPTPRCADLLDPSAVAVEVLEDAVRKILDPVATGAVPVTAGVVGVVPVTGVMVGSMMVMTLPVIPPRLELVGVFFTLN